MSWVGEPTPFACHNSRDKLLPYPYAGSYFDSGFGGSGSGEGLCSHDGQTSALRICGSGNGPEWDATVALTRSNSTSPHKARNGPSTSDNTKPAVQKKAGSSAAFHQDLPSAFPRKSRLL